MLRYCLLIFYILLSGNLVLAQEYFSKEELQSFTKVYLEVKPQGQANDSLIVSLLNKHKVSQERYGEILKVGLMGNKPELSQNELQLQEDILRINASIRDSKKEKEAELCQKYLLPLEKYQEILAHFKASPNFRQELKPYFTTEISKTH
ncbi:MAG: hypothetical protein KDC04_08960 [Saprospiraceae bacterium]|nr:hypothetical protein [Saprospiraceae bacterium]MCB9310569.1 hypothetical protein [Lewinellaceae bacterium]